MGHQPVLSWTGGRQCMAFRKAVAEMTDYIKASMARHKVPRYIEFVEGFPMNAAGKVLKYKMREEAARRLNLVGDGIDTAGNPGK